MASSTVTIVVTTDRRWQDVVNFIDKVQQSGVLNSCDNEEGDMIDVDVQTYTIKTPSGTTINGDYPARSNPHE